MSHHQTHDLPLHGRPCATEQSLNFHCRLSGFVTWRFALGQHSSSWCNYTERYLIKILPFFSLSSWHIVRLTACFCAHIGAGTRPWSLIVCRLVLEEVEKSLRCESFTFLSLQHFSCEFTCMWQLSWRTRRHLCVMSSKEWVVCVN